MVCVAELFVRLKCGTLQALAERKLKVSEVLEEAVNEGLQGKKLFFPGRECCWFDKDVGKQIL